MAYTTINKSGDYFNTKLYSGTGSTNAITGVGFQPDWTWIKARDHAYSHHLQDAVRGTGKDLYSNSTDAEYSNANSLTTFGSDGFTVGSDNGVNNGSKTFASWNWKANGTGSANTDGNITTTVSANTTAGFSIVSWTGTGNAQTLGHGLGSAPNMIILKERSATSQWQVTNDALGWTKRLNLDDTSTADTTSYIWNDTAPTSSVFSIGTSGAVTENGQTYIAYCFAEKTGYSKFGSYTGNGNADGTFVYTGFKPAFVMLKRSSNTSDWYMFDNKREGYNVDNDEIYANLSNVEDTADRLDILSNGFKMRTTGGNLNGSGETFIFMAFASAPLVGSNNVPCTAR